MRKWIAFMLLLLVGAEVFAQGSAPSPPQLWRRKGTADTSIIVIKTGDTVMVYDTAHYTKISIRGANTSWLLPDSLVGTTVRLTDRVIAPTTQIGSNGSGGALVFDNFASSATFYSLIGNGLEEQSGYLTVTIGASVEGSEITNQTIGKVDIDTTAILVAAQFAVGSSASTDNYTKPKHYIDSFLFGYSRNGTPGAGQVPVFDGGTSTWGFGSGGSGSGDDGRFDMTLSNADYVLGATTYTGGYINTSTVWQRGDTGINLVKSGQHPGDTMLHQIDWNRVQRNDSTRNVRTFKTESGEYMMIMEDSSAYTKITTGNSGGTKFNQDLSIDSKLRFFGSNREIDSIYAIKGAPNSDDLDLFDSDGIAIQGLGSDAPVHIGSSTNHTFDSDTLRGLGIQSKIFDYGRVTVDTLNAAREKMQAGQFGIITSTDTAVMITRDTANDTTKMTIVGRLQMIADAGLTEFDSAMFHGRLRMYDGTNKSRIDSASGISADTLKTLPGGYLALQGATSGRTRIRGNASAITSYDITLPAAQGSASQTLVNDGSGNMSWSSAGGGGNGSADFDTVGSKNTNALVGASDTILKVYESGGTQTIISKGNNASLVVGDSAGTVAIDSIGLFYKGAFFGATVYQGTKIDSSFVVNQLKQHRYTFIPTDFYGSPEAYAARHVLTAWNEADTTSFPNNMYKRSSMFYAKDTNGSNTLPYQFTWVAPERDSLFSTVYNILTGFTQADSSSLYAAALYVNETKVDTLNPQKAVTSFTVDSLNWTDRAIAQGDVVTVLLYLKLNPVGTSKKRVDIKDLYLNMRRY